MKSNLSLKSEIEQVTEGFDRALATARRWLTRSIRVQLIMTIGICTLAGSIVYGISNTVDEKFNPSISMDTSDGYNQIQYDASAMVQQIETLNERYTTNPTDPAVQSFSYLDAVNIEAQKSQVKVTLVDQNGKVLVASNNAPERLVDLHQAFRSAMDAQLNFNSGQSKDYTVIYPTTLKAALLKNMVEHANPVPPDQMTTDQQAAPTPAQSEQTQPAPTQQPATIQTAGSATSQPQAQATPEPSTKAATQPTTSKEIVAPVTTATAKDQQVYAIVSGPPQVTIRFMAHTTPWSVVWGIITFLLLFYWLTKRKMRQIEQLAGGLQEIAKGNLDHRVPEKSRDELGSLASNINQMAAELQRTIEEERRAEQTKTELITNVSHDLRTPLTSIMGYLKLLQDKKYETDEQLEEYIQIASGKSEKLKVLIEDLFEYTKLSSQGIRISRRQICLNDVLEQLAEEMVPIGEEQGITIKRTVPPDLCYVWADADKIVRVFENLLSNAIKYSFKPGDIHLELQPEDKHALVKIENRSEPVPPEALDRLFERFYKVESARTSEAGGSGLGLAIAKSIVQLHGGEIWAESAGEQICFYVRLPASEK